MSLFKLLRGPAAIVLALGTLAALGGCTFSPVYSGLTEQSSLSLAYAKPRTRLEQIVYQELAFRLGTTERPDAPLASVSISTAGGDLAMSQTINPNKAREISVTATLAILRRDGVSEDPLILTRTATANFTRNGQVLADTEAETEAAERAALAVAESLRLAILATLSR